MCPCYQVQAHSAHHTIGQWIRETRCWGKEETLIREPADREDGKLVPQNNHLIGVWMPGCYLWSEREKQWGTKVKKQKRGRCSGEVKWKSLQFCKTTPREWPAFRRGVLISSIHRWAGTNYLSRSWTKALYSQAREQVCLVIAGTKVHLVKAMVFPVVMYGCESWTIKKLSTKELMLLNSGVGEDSWESLGLQGDPTSPS